jgi:hypothetical protein
MIDPSPCPKIPRQDSWETHWRVLRAGRRLPSGSAKPISPSPVAALGVAWAVQLPLGLPYFPAVADGLGPKSPEGQ